MVDSDFVQSLSTFVVGALGAVTALVLALKRRAAEEELPALRQRNEELEEELRGARKEILELDRRNFGLERLATQNDIAIPPHLQRPAPLPPVRRLPRKADEG